MSLISKVKDIIFKSGSSTKKKKHFHNVKLDSPEELWDIVGELGDGAYGKVYKAQHKETKQLAALKQVALEEEEDLETFMIEIDILSECKHENIVELLEAYHYDGKLWMYLEYCDGGAMDSIMAELYRPLTEPQIAYVCKYLVEALVYIHEHKVIHRDLKAGNVLLTMDGGVKLADFGVSAKNKNTYDKRGTFIGTPYWLAPEVILCETFIDAKYDYKADVWSLGISLIEFAQMDPPNHEVSPVRVILKIQKADPPRLDHPSKYSKEFNDFISKCLVKDPALRPTAPELLKHPFISRDLDSKPIRDLLLEYKAEVVDEDMDEDGDDQRISRISEDEPSHGNHFAEVSNTICKLPNVDNTVIENKQSPDKEKSEVVVPVSGEGRKGHAPPPPPPSVSSTSNTPPVCSVSSSSSKKGPAPAVPTSTTPSKPKAPPSPADLSPDGTVGESVVVNTPANTNTVIQTTTTPSPPPSEKNSAPHPVTINENVKPKEESSLPLKVDTTSSSKQNIVSVPCKDNSSETTTITENTVTVQETDKDVKTSRETVSDSMKSSLINDESTVTEVKIDVTDTTSHISDEITTTTTTEKHQVYVQDMSSQSSSNKKLEESQQDVNLISSEVKIDTSQGKEKDESMTSSYDVSIHQSPVVCDGSNLSSSSSSSISNSSAVSGDQTQTCNEQSSKDEAVVVSSALLTPGSPDAVIASIGSDATVIVRTPTPTPTPQEPPQSQPTVRKDSVVTYSGPAIVEKEVDEEDEGKLPREDPDKKMNRSSLPSPSMSEAEEQAVLCLDNAIQSAEDVVVAAASSSSSAKFTPDHDIDTTVTLSGSSVILSPDEVEMKTTDSLFAKDNDAVVDSVSKDLTAEIMMEGQSVTSDGHKLDESEVVICNSSILHEGQQQQQQEQEQQQPESHSTSYSPYVSGDDLETSEVISPPATSSSSSTSANDTTHISVVPVDDSLDEPTNINKCQDSVISNDASQPPPPQPPQLDHNKTPVKKISVPSDTDHQGHLETSSNISNISNLSGGTASTGHSVSSGEEGNKSAVSLHIEGTTVGATDVDDDVFSHSEDSKDTPVPCSPEVKLLHNGIEKDAHKTTEKSDWDTVSTVSSEKDVRHRDKDDESLDGVVLRRSHRSDSSDISIQPLEKHRERNARTRAENDLVALRKKTRKRTRKFVVDGVVVTTRQVFYEDEGTATGHFARKQELRELKILQKLEQKQFQKLAVEANLARAEQEKEFENEKQQLLRTYDADIEALNRQQKQQVEKAESLQEIELKNASKKIRAEQERNLKTFRESLKTELKLLKQEIDLLPKDKRKDAFKTRKECLDVDQSEREKERLESLNEAHETSLLRLVEDHRERIALLERQFLQQKHQLLRSRESALWETEERHLHAKHQLAKKQLKDIFFLQRHQMLLRHEKELEQVKRVNQHKEEELIKRQQIERRQLPKRIRQEMKARELMFRESMRISTSHLPDSHEDEKNKIRKFQENEKRRYEAEKKRAEQKHQRKLEELQAASEYTVKELEQLQNEKRKMLMEHETNKLKSQDEEYHRELREWKDNLKPRKQKLEEEFERQLNEQEQFYGEYLSRRLDSVLTPSQSSSSLARSTAS